MQLYTIETGFFKLDGGAMYGVVPKQMWNKLNPADGNNLCTWAMRCLLIEDGNKLILVDTGIGDKQDAKFLGHYHLHGNDSLDKRLAAKGFNRADVTDVFLTHLHFDHCGGAILKEGELLVPAFKNAVYWSNERHWKWATQPNDREKASFLKENILPIEQSGQLKMVATNDNKTSSTELSNSISVVTVNGHTDAMMLPRISYDGRIIYFMADLMPSVGHLPIPYVMAYDMFPHTTLQEKKEFLLTALQENAVLFFEHDPVNECCTLQQTEKGIRQKEVFKLEDL